MSFSSANGAGCEDPIVRCRVWLSPSSVLCKSSLHGIIGFSSEVSVHQVRYSDKHLSLESFEALNSKPCPLLGLSGSDIQVLRKRVLKHIDGVVRPKFNIAKADDINFTLFGVMAALFATGVISGKRIKEYIDHLGHRAMDFIAYLARACGRNAAEGMKESFVVTEDQVTSILQKVFKVIELGAMAVCIKTIANKMSTLSEWASLFALVLIPKFGEYGVTKFLEIFQVPQTQGTGDCIDSFVTVFFTLLSVLFTGKFSNAAVNNFFRLSDLTGCKDLFKEFSKKSMGIITDMVVNFLRFLATFRSSQSMQEMMADIDLTEQKKNVIRKIPSLLQRATEAVCICTQMPSDPSLYNCLPELQDLVVQMAEALKTVSHMNQYPVYDRVHLSREYVKLHEAVMSAVNVRNTKRRVEPTVVYLSGPPGIMKTTFAGDLIAAVAQQLYPKEYDEGTFCYDRNPLQKHWDRYCNQPILRMEECFSTPSTARETTNEEHTAWLPLISSNVYGLTMASINDKKTVFTSEVVVCTSNVAFPDTKSVDRQAMYRRFHNHILCCWKPGFPDYNAANATNTGAQRDFSHMTLYCHDTQRALLPPAGNQQRIWDGRSAPYSVDEFTQWPTISEVPAGAGNAVTYRNVYNPITFDEIVDNVVASVHQRRRFANIDAAAQNDDTCQSSDVIGFDEKIEDVIPLMLHADVVSDMPLSMTVSSSVKKQIHELKKLDDLIDCDPSDLRQLRGTRAQRVFRVWEQHNVSPDITDDRLGGGAMSSKLIAHLDLVMEIVAGYRVYIMEPNIGPRFRLRQLGIYPDEATNASYGETDLFWYAALPMYLPQKQRLPTVISLDNVEAHRFSFTKEAYDDLMILLDQHKITRGSCHIPKMMFKKARDYVGLHAHSNWVDWTTTIATYIYSIAIFLFAALNVIRFIKTLIVLVLELFWPVRQAHSSDEMDQEIGRMLGAAKNQGLRWNYDSSGENAGYYDSNGKRHVWNSKNGKFESYDDETNSKSKGSKKNRKNRMRKYYAKTEDWIDALHEDIEIGGPVVATSSPTMSLIERISSQFVHVTYKSPNGRNLSMYGIQVMENWVMIPQHILAQESLNLYNFHVETDSYAFDEVVPSSKILFFNSAKGVVGYNLELSDGIVIKFQNLKIQKSLLGHLVRAPLKPTFMRDYSAVALVPQIKQSAVGQRFTVAVPCGKISTLGNLDYRDGEDLRYRAHLYTTDIPDMVKGDCGSLLVVKEDGQLRIAGMHVAGDAASTRNFFQPVSQSLISSLLDSIVVVKGFESYPPIDGYKDTSFRMSPTESSPLAPIGRYQFADSHGVTAIPPSEILPSPIQKENSQLFGHGVATLPAALNFESLQKAVNKKWHTPGFFNPAILHQSKMWAIQNLSSHIEECAMLPFDDAVDGKTHFGQTSGLSMTTSAGLPWTIIKDPKAPGKSDFFDKEGDCYRAKDNVRVAVNEVLTGRTKGELKPMLFRGTLKDERRDIERVRDNKTRLFTAAPLEKVIADRMLFGDFQVQFKNCKIKAPHAYGINSEGLEWSEMIMQHLQVGTKHFGFDYSGFDASESLQLLHSVSDVVAEFYPMDLKKHVYASGVESFNHFVVIDGDVYHYHQGNPSGCVMTTIYNTIANWILLQYAWITLSLERGLVPDYQVFKKNCIMHAYGDDFICTVSKDFDWFNGETVPPILSICGITATAPDKSTCAKFYPLSELTFLKRSFVPSPFGCKALFVGPLNKETIEDIPMWMFKGADDDDFLSTMRTCLRSAAMWGKQYFEWYVGELKRTNAGKHFLSKLDVCSIYQQMSFVFAPVKETTSLYPRLFFNCATGSTRYLSNFYTQKNIVTYKSNFFPSVECAYQCAKALFHESDEAKHQPIIALYQSYSSKMAKQIGNTIVTNPTWNRIKPRIMSEILMTKFTDLNKFEGVTLKSLLLQTGNSVLVEKIPDTYWGWGLPMDRDPDIHTSWPGNNHLGLLLMDVRNRVKVSLC